MKNRVKPLTSMKHKAPQRPVAAQKDAGIIMLQEKKQNRPSWQEQLEKKALFQI